MIRPTNDKYFIDIAEAVSKRATCAKRQVGCVIADKDYQILATGYNSVPRGLPHCINEATCPGATSGCVTRHAEDVALMKCSDIYRIHTIYITLQPCLKCVRRILDTSAKVIVFRDSIDDDAGIDLWESERKPWIQLDVKRSPQYWMEG